MRTYLYCKKHRAAFTLIELMIASGLGAVLLAAIAALSSYTARSYSAISNYVDLDRQSRKALDRLTLMIRESDGVTAFATNSVTMSYHATPLVYSYDAGAQTLTENLNGAKTTVLKGCTSFAFALLQRNTQGGTYDQYPAALDSSEVKIIQVSWICSRKLVNSLMNTESIQSAKIVIRK